MDMSETWPPVSIVIRTCNVAPWIGETLTALSDQNYPGETEILVVDSGSTDETLEIAAGFPVQILHLPFPFTYGGALNFGDTAARHPLLVHLSADAMPAHAGYLRAIVAPLRIEEVAAAFGRDLPRPSASPSQARDLETWFPAQGTLDPAFRFSNANACVRQEVWKRFPFDESPLGVEDIRWARQVLRAGYDIVYARQAMTFHTHSASLRWVFRTARRQRASLVTFEPQEWAFSIWAALRFWIGLSLLDIGYAVTRRYPPWQWLHPCVYRAAQALGLYWGAHAGPRGLSLGSRSRRSRSIPSTGP
jgi:rhamnosyltransferase